MKEDRVPPPTGIQHRLPDEQNALCHSRGVRHNESSSLEPFEGALCAVSQLPPVSDITEAARQDTNPNSMSSTTTETGPKPLKAQKPSKACLANPYPSTAAGPSSASWRYDNDTSLTSPIDGDATVARRALCTRLHDLSRANLNRKREFEELLGVFELDLSLYPSKDYYGVAEALGAFELDVLALQKVVQKALRERSGCENDSRAEAADLTTRPESAHIKGSSRPRSWDIQTTAPVSETERRRRSDPIIIANHRKTSDAIKKPNIFTSWVKRLSNSSSSTTDGRSSSRSSSTATSTSNSLPTKTSKTHSLESSTPTLPPPLLTALTSHTTFLELLNTDIDRLRDGIFASLCPSSCYADLRAPGFVLHGGFRERICEVTAQAAELGRRGRGLGRDVECELGCR